MNPQNLILIVAMMAAFWFLLIRPQQQRQKKQAAMLAGLTPGSEIVTIGGIYGTIVEVGERVRLRVADGSEIEIAPQAVAQVLDSEPQVEDSDDDTDEDDAAQTAGDTVLPEPTWESEADAGTAASDPAAAPVGEETSPHA